MSLFVHPDSQELFPLKMSIRHTGLPRGSFDCKTPGAHYGCPRLFKGHAQYITGWYRSNTCVKYLKSQPQLKPTLMASDFTGLPWRRLNCWRKRELRESAAAFSCLLRWPEDLQPSPQAEHMALPYTHLHNDSLCRSERLKRPFVW